MIKSRHHNFTFLHFPLFLFKSLLAYLCSRSPRGINGFCCTFRPAFGCWALQTLVEIVIFSVFTLICFGVNNSIILGGKQIFYKIVNDSQLFIGKNVFLEEKAHFLGVKQSTSVLVQTQKNLFFDKICSKFFDFFKKKWVKTLKMVIWTSIWSAQHPNAGWNIQQVSYYFTAIKHSSNI